MRKLLAEFFGTMFLVLLACGSAVLAGPKIGTLGIGLCFGLILVALCYAIGGISGCHVNPAVSLGVYLTDRKFTFTDLCGYIGAQCLGAAVGGALLFWLMYSGGFFANATFADGAVTFAKGAFEFGGITPRIGTGSDYSYLATNVCQSGVSQGFALLTEILLTFLFVFVVLGSTSKWGNGTMAGLAIGLTLGLVNIVGIPVDNCSVNPARSFGPSLFSVNAWGDFWIMIVGPFIGAILAAVAFKLLRPMKEMEVKF